VKRYYLLVFEFNTFHASRVPRRRVEWIHLAIYNAPPCRNVIRFTLVEDFYRGAKEKGGAQLDHAKHFAQLAYGCKGCCAYCLPSDLSLRSDNLITTYSPCPIEAVARSAARAL
jgi:hypothetical protein